MQAVEVRAVTKRFAHHVAVRGVSLAIPRGCVYGVLGPNGAGKTTTIRMILNILEPDTGAVEVLGRPNSDPALRSRIGYLPEERGLYRKIPVRRTLSFLAQLRGMERKAADGAIDRWLDRMGLRDAAKDWGKAPLEELSRGMQQKIQFIGTILHDPELIILDEPLSGLDPVNAQVVSDVIQEMRSQGKTVIFSTHVMANAERLCDAVCIIARGEKVLDGTVADLKSRNASRYVLISCEDAAAATAALTPQLIQRSERHGSDVTVELSPQATPDMLLSTLVLAGARVNRFEPMQPSLHQIFLEAVGGDATAIEEKMGSESS